MPTIQIQNGWIEVLPTRLGDVQISMASYERLEAMVGLLSPEQCRVLADLLANSGRGNSWDSITEVSGVKKAPPKEKDDVVGPV